MIEKENRSGEVAEVNISGWFSSLDLKQKVRYLFILAISISVLLCFMVFYFVLRNRMTSTSLEKGRNSLSSVNQNFYGEINSVNNISRLIMVNDRVTSYLKSEHESPVFSNLARSEIYSILNYFPGHYSVFVFRNDQQSISTGIGIITADNSVIFGGSRYESVSRKNGGYVLLPNTDGAFTSNTSSEYITFSRIINDIDSQLPIGMLVINIPIDAIEKTYSGLADSDNHFAFYDADGMMLCGDDYFDADKPIATVTDTFSQTIQGGVFDKQVMSSMPVADYGFTSVCVMSVQLMEGMSVEVAGSLLCILVAMIIIMAIINTYINKYITVPIHKLVDSMTQVKSGKLHRVSISSNNDEIGKLKDNYNEMLVQINRLIEELIEKEQNRQKVEMEALQEQIKPHFLYNTLDTIAYMSLQNTPGEVYDAIETLGNFYRRFLSRGSKTIPLSDEVAIVRDYIKLQRLRYEDIFTDEYDIAPDTEMIRVPKLILQPLVENSIYHGIREKGETGVIRVSSELVDNVLRIKVYDTGIGMNPEQIKRLMDSGNTRSFGFKGTMERIRYFSHAEDVFDIRSEEGKFCEVEIKIPLDKDDEYVQGDDS